jgi:hypothetical protein
MNLKNWIQHQSVKKRVQPGSGGWIVLEERKQSSFVPRTTYRLYFLLLWVRNEIGITFVVDYLRVYY